MGSTNVVQRARVRVTEILDSHYPRHIDAELDAKIRREFPIRLPPGNMSPKTGPNTGTWAGERQGDEGEIARARRGERREGERWRGPCIAGHQGCNGTPAGECPCRGLRAPDGDAT